MRNRTFDSSPGITYTKNYAGSPYPLTPAQLKAAKDGLAGRNKFIWLSDHWKDYFDVVPVNAGVATLERVEVIAGLKSGDQVALEDPSKKRVEKDDEDN